ncbi:E3 ubiquitin-protein ligase SIRP1-like [Impatiens glandulifera]|uniref:E3 ubiquitin-protein ligase SIRP1-like n=1 Tax=Impatiens glandulifera TaxID=253017 RepID=UPI001FB09083|nr:E3 ubiquitin-protein ligase SIRP1-like [Impatiens glandulifera]
MSTSLFDDFFDLDMVLTIPEEVSTSTTTAGGAKGSPSPAMIAQKMADMVLKMPTVSAPPGHSCTVCMERFEVGSTAKELLVCGHVYHEGCITTWLSLHDSCPLCRSKVISGGR